MQWRKQTDKQTDRHGDLFLFFISLLQTKHTCKNLLPYKAIYVHIFMVSGALRYFKAPVRWLCSPGSCLAPPRDGRLTWLLLFVVKEIHKYGPTGYFHGPT